MLQDSIASSLINSYPALHLYRPLLPPSLPYRTFRNPFSFCRDIQPLLQMASNSLEKVIPSCKTFMQTLRQCRVILKENDTNRKTILNRTRRLHQLLQDLQACQRKIMHRQTKIASKLQFQHFVCGLFGELGKLMNHLAQEYRQAQQCRVQSNIVLSEGPPNSNQYAADFMLIQDRLTKIQLEITNLVNQALNSSKQNYAMKCINLANNTKSVMVQMRTAFGPSGVYQRVLKCQSAVLDAVQNRLCNELNKFQRFYRQLYRDVLLVYFLDHVVQGKLIEMNHRLINNQEKAVKWFRNQSSQADESLVEKQTAKAKQYQEFIVRSKCLFFQSYFTKKAEKRLFLILKFVQEAARFKKRLQHLFLFVQKQLQLARTSTPLLQKLRFLEDPSSFMSVDPLDREQLFEKKFSEVEQFIGLINNYISFFSQVQIPDLKPKSEQIKKTCFSLLKNAQNCFSAIKSEYLKSSLITNHTYKQALNQIDNQINQVTAYLQKYSITQGNSLEFEVIDIYFDQVYKKLILVKKGQATLHQLSLKTQLTDLQRQKAIGSKLRVCLSNLELLSCMFETKIFAVQKLDDFLRDQQIGGKSGYQSLLKDMTYFIRTLKENIDFEPMNRSPKIVKSAQLRLQIFRVIHGLFDDLSKITQKLVHHYKLPSNKSGQISPELTKRLSSQLVCMTQLVALRKQVNDIDQIQSHIRQTFLLMMSEYQKKVQKYVGYSLDQLKSIIGSIDDLIALRDTVEKLAPRVAQSFKNNFNKSQIIQEFRKILQSTAKQTKTLLQQTRLMERPQNAQFLQLKDGVQEVLRALERDQFGQGSTLVAKRIKRLI